MSALKNKVILIGNVGNNAEVKTLDSGKAVARIALATNDYYKDSKGQRISETQWHNLVIWGKQAELAGKFLIKGSEIAVEGKLVNRNYTDKDGVKRYVTEVVVSEFSLLGNRKN